MKTLVLIFFVVMCCMLLSSCSDYPTEPLENALGIAGSEAGRDAPGASEGLRDPAATQSITPGTPTVHLEVISQHEIRISWTPTAPFTQSGYYVRRRDLNYIEIFPPPYDVPNPRATMKNVHGYSCNSPVGQWEVIAYKDYQRRRYFSLPGTPPAKEWGMRTGACTPAAPSDFIGKPIDQTSIELSWNDNSSNESGFGIERCATTDCNGYEPVAFVPPNSTRYIVTGMTCGRYEGFRVRAFSTTNGRTYYSGYANCPTNGNLPVCWVSTLPCPPAPHL